MRIYWICKKADKSFQNRDKSRSFGEIFRGMNYISENNDFDGLHEVNEALSLYVKKDLGKANASLSFLDFFHDKLLIIKAIKAGLPFHIFSQIKSFVLFSDSDWADYLDISLKSLQRYREDKDFRFKSIHSEKILEIAEVTQFGIEVFGSFEKFEKWLNFPSFALGGYKPSELISDSYGKELVMAELNAIEHGIFA